MSKVNKLFSRCKKKFVQKRKYEMYINSVKTFYLNDRCFDKYIS